MKTSDFMKSLFIIIVFIIIIFTNVISMGMDNIKENWHEYKCNPAVMPFASLFGKDTVKNFNECIQGSQKSIMGMFLSPIYMLFGILASSVKSVLGSLDFVKLRMNSIFGNMFQIFGRVFGAVGNVSIEFQRILIKLKATFGKIIASLVVLINIFQGLSLTGKSIWNGPVGETLRFVCFSPDTPIKMIDGTHKLIKDIQVNDSLYIDDTMRNILNEQYKFYNPFLENNVISIMKIRGNSLDGSHAINWNEDNRLFRLHSNELENDIYVTGSHYVFNPETKVFEKMKDYSKSYSTDKKEEYFYCLITDCHLIYSGEHVFWDWEDEILS